MKFNTKVIHGNKLYFKINKRLKEKDIEQSNIFWLNLFKEINTIFVSMFPKNL